MSFAYLPLFTGDYLRDTRHLTPLKHGIFLLALMHCWDSKGPMPLDEQECAGICNCRSADEIESLRYILSRFFTRMEDGHYNHRMQREVERSEQISGARSEAGRKGYEARAKHLKSKSQAIAKQVHLSPSPSPSPSPSLHQENQLRASATALDPSVLTADGLTEQTAVEFIAHRKRKRAPLTQRAWDGIKREAAKAGWGIEDAVCKALERGWQSFDASFVAKEKPPQRSLRDI